VVGQTRMPAQIGRFSWTKPLATDGCDNSPEIRVRVPVGDDVRAKDCDVKIGRKTLRVGIRGQQPIIDDALWKECDAEESTWEFAQDGGERCIIVTILKKGKWDVWTHLLRCEEVVLDTSITRRAFLDITADGELLGRIVVGLYGNLVPKTVDNFCLLCTGERGQTEEGAMIHYKGSPFHRIVTDYICQGGDYERGDGTGGESAFGGRFHDECMELRHDRAGLLCMASAEKDMNGSQFFITLRELRNLDGKHVVFGEVIQGFEEVVQRMAHFGSTTGGTTKTIIIADCGLLAA